MTGKDYNRDLNWGCSEMNQSCLNFQPDLYEG
jgi:hypothetical protein